MKILMSRKSRYSKESLNAIIARAVDGNTLSDSELWQLVLSDEYSLRYNVLDWCDYLTDEMLDVLACDPESSIRTKVAKYATVTDDILYELSRDTDFEVMNAAHRALYGRHKLL